MHLRNCVGDDVGDDAAPAGVNGGDDFSGSIAQQNRHAVGGADGEDFFGVGCEKGIGLLAVFKSWGIGVGDDAAVDLMNEATIARSGENRRLEELVVLLDSIGVVLDGAAGGVAEVQAVHGRGAYSA